MYNILAFISLLLSCYFLLRIIKPAGVAESVLVFFCLFTSLIIVNGYVLSYINHLGVIQYWLVLGLLTALLCGIAFLWNRQSTGVSESKWTSLGSIFSFIKDWYRELSTFEKVLLTPLILTVVFLGVLNLTVIVLTAPHHWDGLTYHLARVAYYLQQNNMNYFGANYWAQVIHPKNSTVLFLYTYLISGRNENLIQLVQFTAYWVSICAVYAISRKAGNSRTQSVFAALISALLIEWLMQATTTQNDLLLTAYFGAVIYFLFAFRETSEGKYLLLAALGIGLSIGTKASAFLVLGSVASVAFYSLLQIRTRQPYKLSQSAMLMAGMLLVVLLFTLPAGSMENYQRYGNPIGPQDVREHHSFEGEPVSYLARYGTLNLARYGFEFLALDGLPPINAIQKTQTWITAIPEKALHLLSIYPETSEATIRPFNIHERPLAHEDHSYWGILGFGLIWIVVFLSVAGVFRSTDLRILSIAAVIFLFFQAYAGPFDPFRGRYFTVAAIFAVPPVGACLRSTNKFLRGYILLVVLLGCISALSAVILRDNSTLISIRIHGEQRTSIFTMDRIQQLTRNRVRYYEPLQNFEQIVPSDATVAVYLNADAYEYPLFGEHLTRTILPINSFDRGLQPIPLQAEYLLYTESFPCANLQDDIHLGTDWYLRLLNENNRQCP